MTISPISFIDLTDDASTEMNSLHAPHLQCWCCSQNNGQVSLGIIYVHFTQHLWHQSIPERFFLILETKALPTSASYLAEISVTPPPKLFTFINKNNNFWIKVSYKLIYFILKIEALLPTCPGRSVVASSLDRQAKLTLGSLTNVSHFACLATGTCWAFTTPCTFELRASPRIRFVPATRGPAVFITAASAPSSSSGSISVLTPATSTTKIRSHFVSKTKLNVSGRLLFRK